MLYSKSTSSIELTPTAESLLDVFYPFPPLAQDKDHACFQSLPKNDTTIAGSGKLRSAMLCQDAAGEWLDVDARQAAAVPERRSRTHMHAHAHARTHKHTLSIYERTKERELWGCRV